MEDLPTAAVYLPTQPCTKEEEDCAMLTALGGRWCPEANLQNSEFTKVTQQCLVNNTQCIIHLNVHSYLSAWQTEILTIKGALSIAEVLHIFYRQPIFATFSFFVITVVRHVTSNEVLLLGQSYHLTGEDIFSPYIRLLSQSKRVSTAVR